MILSLGGKTITFDTVHSSGLGRIPLPLVGAVKMCKEILIS